MDIQKSNTADKGTESNLNLQTNNLTVDNPPQLSKIINQGELPSTEMTGKYNTKTPDSKIKISQDKIETENIHKMFVIKRSGAKESMLLDKITVRLQHLIACEPPLTSIDAVVITMEVVRSLISGITTTQIDEIAATVCDNFALSTGNREYEILATRILLSNLYKNTCPQFSDFIEYVAANSDLLADWVAPFVRTHAVKLNTMIDESRDTQFALLGLKTIIATYLLPVNNVVVERPQYLWLRCALEIWRDDFDNVKTTYDFLSKFIFTHATPTLYNSCLNKNQLSSCMLLTNKGDSIDGIYDTLRDCSKLGAESAGIGTDFTNIRARGSNIKSTNRPSKGLVPFLNVHHANVCAIDQGGKRKMSMCVYLQPWHSDFLDVLNMRANDNADGAHELFYAVWNNNLLNKRVKENGMWSFFCPSKAPKLLTTYGAEFEEAYIAYENTPGLVISQMPAQELYVKIATMMLETGVPYHLNKDACNFKNNMRNVAITNCSNLCTEITIPSGEIDGEQQIGVCTLASVNLTAFTTCAKLDNNGDIAEPGKFDFMGMRAAVRQMVKNLNRIIDVQRYTLPECRRSSERNRPIGVGVQGLAEVFMMLGFTYEGKEAARLNSEIAEEIYYAAICESMELSKKEGIYSTFPGSPASQGKLQPQLWEDYNRMNGIHFPMQYKYDWQEMGKLVAEVGLRNALLVAYMPTASTSRIFNTIAGFDPNPRNIYSKKTLVGEFVIFNRRLVDTLTALGLWNQKLKNEIINANGIVADIKVIPPRIRDIYKTAFEMKMRNIMDMAATRGHFICQSQSMNMFFNEPNINKVVSALCYGMSIGLKTVSYYTRAVPAANAVKLTIMDGTNNETTGSDTSSAPIVCSRENKDCESCMA